MYTMNLVTLGLIAEIEQLHQEGISRNDIGQILGQEPAAIGKILLGQHKLQIGAAPISRTIRRCKTQAAVVAIVGERANHGMGQGNQFMPTPLQIESACQAIRERWSEEERFKRL
jgi:hypothetical protein